MSDGQEPEDPAASGDVDPEAFLRALLRISSEDAAEVRRIAAEKTARGEKEDGTGNSPSD